MKRRTLFVWLAAGFFGLMALPPLTLLFIPDAAIRQTASQALAAHGIKLQATRLGTAMPFGIKATGVTLADSQTALINLEQVSLQLRLLPLLTGKVSANVSAKAGAGNLTGTVTILPALQGTLQVTNLELADIPLLATASGGTIKGTAKIDLTLPSVQKSGADGTARLHIKNIQLKGVRISNMPLPDVSFPELRGIVKIKGQTVSIDNLALQGDGIYLRLGGTASLAAGSALNFNLELLPSAEFLEQQKSVFLFMIPYQISPGHYKLPITGTLSSPQLAGR